MNVFKLLPFVFLSLSLLLITSCHKDDAVDCPPVMTDSDANLNQFLGLWYEISSYKQFFNIGCACTTAEYTLDSDGSTIIVNNSCRRFGLPSKIRGTGVAPDPSDFSKLEVSFPINPNPGEYWILEFAEDGSYMMVGDSNRNQFYILSRTPVLDDAIYSALIEQAVEMCFDIDDIVLTNQSSCNN